MAGKSQVEGITIEFEGNTISFDKSVDGVKKALNLLKKEKTVLDKEFKKTNDIDKLNKALENLKRQEELASQGAQMAAEKVSELANAGKAGTKEYDAYNRKWAEFKLQATMVGLKIDELTDKINSFIRTPIEELGDKFDSLGQKAGNVSGKIQDVANAFRPLSDNAQKVLKSSVSNIIDFESAFANVKKTIDETDATSYEDLATAIRQVATEIPTTANEFAEIVAMSGQMGVGADNVIEFSKAMVDLGNSTNINAKEASETIAQLYNVMGKGGDFSDIEAFSSAIVELGNNTATTEKNIVEMASNIGAAATRVGMSESEILGLSATLASLGLDKGGASAISRVMTEIDMAVATNSDELKTWADTAKMSVESFSALWSSNASAGLGAFIQGLADAKGEGDNLNKLLDDLGITELRQIDTISRLTNASEQLAKYTDMSNKAYADQTALQEEADKRYQTLASRIQVIKNKITEFALEIGEQLMPILDKVVAFISDWTGKLNGLSDSEKSTITITSALLAVITPLLSFIAGLILKFGKLSTAIGGILKNEKVATFLGKLTANGSSLSKVLSTLFKTVKNLINPVTAIIALVAMAYATNDDFRESVNQLITTLWNMLAPVLKNVGSLFEMLWGVITTVWDIVQKLISIFADLFTTFQDSEAFNVLVILFQFVLDIINQVIEAVKTLIGWIQSLLDWVRQALDWLSRLISKQNDAVSNQYSATTGGNGGTRSGGYGALNSGGFTLNASFNVSTSAITRNEVRSWASWLADDINNELGRRIK